MELLCNSYLKKTETQPTVSESSSIGKGIAQEGFRLRAFRPFRNVHLLNLLGHCTCPKEKSMNPLKRFSAVLRLKVVLSHREE